MRNAELPKPSKWLLSRYAQSAHLSTNKCINPSFHPSSHPSVHASIVSTFMHNVITCQASLHMCHSTSPSSSLGLLSSESPSYLTVFVAQHSVRVLCLCTPHDAMYLNAVSTTVSTAPGFDDQCELLHGRFRAHPPTGQTVSVRPQASSCRACSETADRLHVHPHNVLLLQLIGRLCTLKTHSSVTPQIRRVAESLVLHLGSLRHGALRCIRLFAAACKIQ